MMDCRYSSTWIFFGSYTVARKIVTCFGLATFSLEADRRMPLRKSRKKMYSLRNIRIPAEGKNKMTGGTVHKISEQRYLIFKHMSKYNITHSTAVLAI